ncbi:hypothetical protein M0R45_013939 [Rubus argutus]|uniref:Uncharacterized protein n=1 Tax=Rubus argutus TaxID=59490 RepID=A0AAW1XNG5_RUBAR
MGTGWSQREASQSQQQSPGEPSYTEVVEIKATPPKKSGPKEVVQGKEKTTVAQVKKQQQQLPHNYEAIVKDADSPINKSAEHLFGHLYAGILLNQKRKKYWIDKNSNNCFMVYPRDLTITWAEDNRYWEWPCLEETSNVFIDVAELLDVCWLDVSGQFDAAKLSPGTLYEVVFVVMLKAEGGGWEVPVNVRLSLPDGNKQEHKVNLMEKARGQWIEIPVGEFRASPGKLGDIKFSMYEHGGHWKNGLVIKGVAIRPKD